MELVVFGGETHQKLQPTDGGRENLQLAVVQTQRLGPRSEGLQHVTVCHVVAMTTNQPHPLDLQCSKFYSKTTANNLGTRRLRKMAWWSCAVVLVLAAAAGDLAYGASNNGNVLVKPAVVPFMDHKGTLLVHVDRDLQQRVKVLDKRGTMLQRGGAPSAHVDRHGYRWLHIPLDLSPLPHGASTLRVIAGEGEGVEVKVVRAAPRSGAVLVDNVRGCVVGRDGLPFFPFGPYTYGVKTAGARSVPETEVVYGE